VTATGVAGTLPLNPRCGRRRPIHRMLHSHLESAAPGGSLPSKSVKRMPRVSKLRQK
jgi:hypothetical protein